MNKSVGVLGAIVLAAGVLIGPYAFATSPDFIVVSFGIVGGNPSMTVEGTAGGTIPTQTGDIYAYVFVTNKGIFAVTSHPGIEDSDEVDDDTDWHAHQVTLDSSGCVTGINDNGIASLEGSTVSVTGTGAKKVDGVLTAVLSVSDKGICVVHVFDSAP